MPETTAEMPHAITCIKHSIRDLLKEHCKRDLTISCDRADCWDDDELFKWRQAVNIVTGTDFIGNPVKGPREAKKLSDMRGQKDSPCWHEATLNINITTFVEDCDCDEDDDDCDCQNGTSKAYSIMAHITHVLTSYQHQIAGRRILYRGSQIERDTENEKDLIALTANFEVHYLFDQTRPWVVR